MDGGSGGSVDSRIVGVLVRGGELGVFLLRVLAAL